LCSERFQPLPASLPLTDHLNSDLMAESSVAWATSSIALRTASSRFLTAISCRNDAYIASSPGSGGTWSSTASNWSKNFAGTTHLVSPSDLAPGKCGSLDQSTALTLASNSVSG